VKAEFVRYQNEIGIRNLRDQAPGRARIETKSKRGSVEPVDNTPSGFQQLMDLLGHADVDFVQGLLKQLGSACRGPHGIDEDGVNFFLSFIKSLKPRDEVEVLLAAQMAAVHWAAMDEAQRLNRAETWQGHDSSVRAVAQLTRTFAAQVAGLKHYRTGGEQKVTVQHVSVNDGGQAIVAQVTHAAPSAAESVSEARALAPPSPQEQPMEILADRLRAPLPAAKGKSS
jgi:hypothetical protein